MALVTGFSGTVTCEVCGLIQTPQSACARCGLLLKVPKELARAGDPPIEPLPDLEPTRWEPDGLERQGIPAPPLDIERGREESIGDVWVERVLGLEPTAERDSSDPPGQPVPGLEPATEPFEKTVGPEALTPTVCPYCGYRQSSGRVCDYCGRVRSRVLPGIGGDGEAVTVMCAACGARVLPGALCSDCGEPLPVTAS